MSQIAYYLMLYINVFKHFFANAHNHRLSKAIKSYLIIFMSVAHVKIKKNKIKLLIIFKIKIEKMKF